ncbi:P-loop containing nucleoside triphosphate hydrolase protein [Agrocybe pediades]|nr:P-loop containing nucleoside triphosphate hydrolase protein [Agrocybe pediades]
MRLRDYQVEAANVIVSRDRDLCIVAPTGSGKSLTWVLPLLAQRKGISLVIVPFTSLGFQGEQRTFTHSGAAGAEVLERIALGGTMQVIYTCVEMLETPAFARVLYSESFQAQLSGIFIDEAHVVHESHTWRPAYTRLGQVRKIIGTGVPLICLSATFPKRYRDSLETYAALRPSYHLINLGNHRPELSTIVARMRHDANSFLDLAFVLPSNATADSLKQAIIYCDDLQMLTAMFWWFQARLKDFKLPISLLDILHSGLSEDHQLLCTDDFVRGKAKILLGSDKIGAGMDFPNVSLVVQYRCRDLTLVRWEQRRGRGARRDGSTAVGVILVEKSMTGDDGDLTVSSPKTEDPALLDLIHSTTCHIVVVDRWLENPTRPANYTPCERCSNCNPNLRVDFELNWIMESTFNDDSVTTRRKPLSKEERKEVLAELVRWRHECWTCSWMDDWPSYGPDSLVTDTDLEEIASRILTVYTTEHLRCYTQIVHLQDLSAPLLDTLHKIRMSVCGINASVDSEAIQIANSLSEAPHTQDSTPHIPPPSFDNSM